MQHNNPVIPLNQDDEIFLLSILRLIIKAWKTIAVAVLAGLTLSVAYLATSPKQYEASAQIAMAQILANGRNISGNPLGINIEEPQLLIVRMSIPTSYTPQTIVACGLQDQDYAAAVLSKSIKFTIPKGVPGLIELKTLGPSPQVAEQCNIAIFELIKNSQSSITAHYIDQANQKLKYSVERLAKVQGLLATSDKLNSTLGVPIYLSTRDEIRYLLEDINELQNVIATYHDRQTHLIAPIYVNNIPVSPKKQMILSAGFLGGFFSGLLIALKRRIIGTIRSQMGG